MAKAQLLHRRVALKSCNLGQVTKASWIMYLMCRLGPWACFQEWRNISSVYHGGQKYYNENPSVETFTEPPQLLVPSDCSSEGLHLFINNLDDWTECTLSKFEDGTKLGGIAVTLEVRARIQNDLDRLKK